MSHSTPARDGGTRPDGTTYEIAKDESDWQQSLTPAEYHVLREAGTEAPFVGEYTDTKTEGIYRCRACQSELFRSDTKFDSIARFRVTRSRANRWYQSHHGQSASIAALIFPRPP